MCTGIFSPCSEYAEKSPLARCICTHPTQCGQAACGVGATGLGVYGCATGIATGNLALAVASAAGAALSAATAATGMGGMACVHDRIQLNHDITHLEETSSSLKKTAEEREGEIASLKMQLEEISPKLDQLQKEKADIESVRSAQIAAMTKLTQELDATKTELLTIQKKFAACQDDLGAAIKAREQESASLKSENSRLAKSVAELSEQNKAFLQGTDQAAKENERLNKLLKQLEIQEKSLQERIDELVTERAAYDKVVADLTAESEVQQEKIDEGTRQYSEIIDKLQELQRRLENLQPQIMSMNS